uniref:Uncharacterized protein n=1 Tax=Paramoeba aestuarina TaxID=180227 RepID=A0A7S4NK18_9EUKA
MGDVEFAENAEPRESKRRSGETDPQPAATSTNSRKERPKSGAFRSNAVKRQSYHQQHINRRNRQVAAGRSQFGGMLSSDMAIVQLANLKKQWVTEMKQINTQKKRMKDIERNVTELKKQEKGLGVKKANARIAKLEDHLDKMTGLVMDETRERENAEKDVRTLTEEVTKYSKLYEDKCHRVEILVNEKISLERQVLEKKRTFDTMIKEQEARLNAVEEELYGLDEALKRDNMVRNRINDDKKTIESVLDKLRDLQKK